MNDKGYFKLSLCSQSHMGIQNLPVVQPDSNTVQKNYIHLLQILWGAGVAL